MLGIFGSIIGSLAGAGSSLILGGSPSCVIGRDDEGNLVCVNPNSTVQPTASQQIPLTSKPIFYIGAGVVLIVIILILTSNQK